MPGEFHEAQFGYYPIANSQWLREDGTEVPVGMVVVPKTCGHGPRAEDLSEDPLRPVIFPAHPSCPLSDPPPGPPGPPPIRPLTLFFGKGADGWARNFINFLILEKEGQTRFLQ